LFDKDEEGHRAEPIEDKSLVELSNKGKEKRFTSGNALEMAKKNVPALSKPGSETNMIEFNPRN